MTDWRPAVAEAVEAVVLHGATRYSWYGRMSPRLGLNVRRALDPATARAYLKHSLGNLLYREFYTRGAASPLSEEGGPTGGRSDPLLVRRLSEANRGEGCWEDGWRVRAVGDGSVSVERDGHAFLASPGELAPADATADLVPGAAVRVRTPRELLGLSPGFYMATGGRGLPSPHREAHLRIYWHTDPDGAVLLMARATELLGRADLPYRLKVLTHPDAYDRCDAAVLYTAVADYGRTATLVEEVHAALRHRLSPPVPAFTKRLAPGVGLAEDPGGGESFGLHRCRILAEGILRARERRARSPSRKLEIVEATFAGEGIALDAPFLSPGSTDRYRVFEARSASAGTAGTAVAAPGAAAPGVEAPGRARGHGRARGRGAAGTVEGGAEDAPVPAPGDGLAMAERLGRRIVDEAVWAGDRCGWMGHEPEDPAVTPHGARTSYRALGPGLYGGTSGVAWFLAHLHRHTGDPALRRTAEGAMRQALSRVDAVAESVRHALYTGWTGIALAAAEVGELLEAGDLLEAAARLVERCRREAPAADGKSADGTAPGVFDVIAGSAGAIPALLALGRRLGEPAAEELALRLGQGLVATALVDERGWSWGGTERGGRNLTGLSHGAAGAGWAFAELHRHTGDGAFRHAALEAFRYERHWYDPERRNWPDLRTEPTPGRGGRRLHSFATFWCHGAPGIALSRLRAHALLGDGACGEEATAALATTLASVEAQLPAGPVNFSLCHGLAGNADVLLEGARRGAGRPEDDALAQRCLATATEVAARGVRDLARSGTLPCGTGAGATPNLMLGLSGIGYFYLRWADPAVPSVLLPGTDGAAG